MSAYVVSENTMHRVVRAIEKNRQWFAGVPVSSATTRSADAIGAALFAMNIDAVRQRYPRDPEPESFAYRYENHVNSAVVEFKAIQCLLYQCSEGNVPETPLYRELESVALTVASKIIHSLPEYDAADWDAA